jgi:hypothetical protein
MTARASPKSVPVDEAVFRDLVGSAFEFLERAIEEIEHSPKFSTIHFATAVELFLKARLMREHWALIVDHPDKASRQQFLEGRVITVTPRQAIGRLREIAAVTISAEAHRTFEAISERRNRMIHFVHDTPDAKKRAALVNEIVLEQHRGWFHLEQLLTDWTDHLGWAAKRLQNARQAMKKYDRFLRVRFEGLEAKIKAEIAAGARFVSCQSCELRAARCTPVSEQIARLSCVVCDVPGVLFEIPCTNEDCRGIVSFTGVHELPAKCPVCATEYGADEIGELLDTDPATTDNYFEQVAINCAHCMGYHSVVKHHAAFVCTECFEVEDAMAVCEFCNEGQIGGGDLEYSYRTGCEFCDGAQGWERD